MALLATPTSYLAIRSTIRKLANALVGSYLPSEKLKRLNRGISQKKYLSCFLPIFAAIGIALFANGGDP
jgi:hypothetical protein